MIQRIQTLFLLLGSGSCFGLLGLPMAHTDEAVSSSDLFADSVYTLPDNGLLLGIFAAAGLFLLADIFLFRNRTLQMRLALLGLFLIIIGAGLAGYYFFLDPASAQADASAGIALPVVAAIASVLAYRYIQKDEKLVRSADRLR